MVHFLDVSIDKNSTFSLTKTAVKMKLIFTQLIAHYLDNADIVSMGLFPVR